MITEGGLSRREDAEAFAASNGNTQLPRARGRRDGRCANSLLCAWRSATWRSTPGVSRCAAAEGAATLTCCRGAGETRPRGVPARCDFRGLALFPTRRHVPLPTVKSPAGTGALCVFVCYSAQVKVTMIGTGMMRPPGAAGRLRARAGVD